MNAKQLVPIDNSKPAPSVWTDLILAHTEPGAVVLVPFAEDTALAGAALEHDRRVILLVRTPAQRLRLWGKLTPTDEAARRRALARLAGTTKRDTPLDQHINRLYETTCPDCGETSPATAFIWDRPREVPVEKELTCRHCDFQGHAPADDADVDRASQFERRGLSFWFILEWLVDVQDGSGREIARRHLARYSPRNLTALADVTRKIDTELADDPASQRLLRLWLLHTLEAGRQQPDPAGGDRLVERNIWHLLTHPPASDEPDTSVRLTFDLETFWESDPTPNVALAAGPIRKLAQQLPTERIPLILGSPPTLDADAWIWEQLWSRWVFGRGTGGGLQPPVGGWARHVRALGATMAALMPALRPDGRVIFRFQDHDPDRAAAMLTAASLHATLEAFTYQAPLTEPSTLFDAVGGRFHMEFTPASSTTPAAQEPAALAEAIETAAVDAAVDVIGVRAEPLTHGWVFAAGVTHLARTGLLQQAMANLETDVSPLAFAKQHARQGLRAALGGGALTAVPEAEPTHWWLPERPSAEPLAERVEQTTIDLLERDAEITPVDVYRDFGGWLMPERELVEALLSAYGEETERGRWVRHTVAPEEQETLLETLRRLGERLDFAVGAGLADVVWGEGGQASHAFRFVDTGRWDQLGLVDLPESVAGYLVLPGRLVDLLRVKLARNPLLRRELAQRGGWQIIKARHLATLAETDEVDRQDFKKIVGLDPIIEQAEAQMPLF